MENRPTKWNLTEAQKVIQNYKQAKKPIKPKMEHQQSSSKDLN